MKPRENKYTVFSIQEREREKKNYSNVGVLYLGRNDPYYIRFEVGCVKNIDST